MNAAIVDAHRRGVLTAASLMVTGSAAEDAAYVGDSPFDMQAAKAAGHDVQVVHTELDWKGALHWGETARVTVRPVQAWRARCARAFARLPHTAIEHHVRDRLREWS